MELIAGNLDILLLKKKGSIYSVLPDKVNLFFQKERF